MTFRLIKADMAEIEQMRSYLEDVETRVRDFAAELLDKVERLDEQVDERSERWHESDRASEVSDWLDTLREAHEITEALADAVDELASGLGDLEAGPES